MRWRIWSVVVNVSYFYGHVPDADGAICDALAPKRVARLLKVMLPFRTLVETRKKFFGGN
jgi:hypothetical protein